MRATILTFVSNVDAESRPNLTAAIASLSLRLSQAPYQPFSDVPELHFASVVVFETANFPPLLVLECNFDGALAPFLDSLLARAANDVYALFSCCRDFAGYSIAGPNDRAGLGRYLRKHAVRPAAYHIGNVGRPRDRVEREAALCSGLSASLDARLLGRWVPKSANEVFEVLQECVDATPEHEWISQPHARQSLWERVQPVFNIVGAVAILLGILVCLFIWIYRLSGRGMIGLLVSASMLALALLVFVVVLRRHETRDVPMNPASLSLDHVRNLVLVEDIYRLNHLASVTVVKPGLFRRTLLRIVLAAANLAARTSVHGSLAGIPSIHFAHWSLLDGGRRLLFLSNYDGSWGGYLDDFVDKASAGLTAIWSNTVGFPRTRFLIRDGARVGIAFKTFARAEQTATNVWYLADPYRRLGLSVRRIDANSTLREGLAEKPDQSSLADWAMLW